MANFKTQKNLRTNRSEYNGYYGDFRGVDFSSDHTQVASNRFAYLVNMYKDYKSANGNAIETIPGFRRMFEPPGSLIGKNVNGIHRIGDKVIVHIGNYFFRWNNFPYTCGVTHTASVKLPAATTQVTSNGVTMYKYVVDMAAVAESNGGRLGRFAYVLSVKAPNGFYIIENNTTVNIEDGNLSLETSQAKAGDFVTVKYKEDFLPVDDLTIDALRSGVNDQKSISFFAGDRLLILDGRNLYVAKETDSGGVSLHAHGDYGTDDIAYIPTTYKGIVPGGENANAGYEYEQRNVFSSRFKNEFVQCYNEETSQPYPMTLMAPAYAVEAVARRRGDSVRRKQKRIRI